MFYALGVVGFIAVTALPFRLLKHLQRGAWALRSSIRNKLFYFLMLLIGTAAIAFAGSNLSRVGRCLLWFLFSANAAGGWRALGSVGFWYLVYELFAFPVRRFGLKRSGSAT